MTPSSKAAGFGPCFVDDERPSADLDAIERGDRGFGFAVAGHFNKAKTARASAVAIGGQLSTLHGAMRFEQVAEFIFACVE